MNKIFQWNGSRVFLYLAGGLLGYVLMLSSQSQLSLSLLKEEPVFSLWVGSSYGNGSRELRSLEWVRYDPKKRGVQILSFPPHTKIKSTANRPSSLAEIYKKTWGSNPQDVSRTIAQSLQQVLSIPDIPAPFVFELDENVLSSLQCHSTHWNLIRSFVIAFSTVKTNLNLFEKCLFLWELKDVEISKAHQMELPGRSYGAYWIPEDGTAQTAHLMLEGSLKNAQKVTPSLKSQLMLEVWNASGQKNAALEVTRKLRRAGFDVIKWGNNPKIQDHSTVHDLKGNVSEAHEVSKLVSAQAEVFTKIEEQSMVDMIVVVGQDYKGEE